jgi:NAD(P)-dependent dehydrogenase (short-subunit alcohol dehydrogenase family)
MVHPMQTLRNLVILVTGATDGLGKRVARDLAAQGATVLLHGRSREKGEATLREIREATGNQKLICYNADFSSLDAVRQLSEEIQADQERLNVLINNAGAGAGLRQARREKSTDGYELRFAVNYLAPFLLTHRLLPLLRRSAPARIVNVASVGQRPIDFDNIMLEDGYDGLRAYRQSKLALVMFTFDLAEDLRKSGITVNSLHPATLMSTRMVLETDYFGGPMSTVEEGAHAVEYLATSPELGGVTGEYFDGKQRARANAQAYDKEARRRLRILSEQLTKPKESDD